MSHIRPSSSSRRSIALSVNLAILSGVAHAAEIEPVRFPAFRDGHRVPAYFDEPGAEGAVYHDDGRLANDVQIAVDRYCASRPTLPTCALTSAVPREKAGAQGKNSAYSILDITIDTSVSQDKPSETVISGGIELVRSCPSDAMLVTDFGSYMENRDVSSARGPVACISPETLPKTTSLGMPKETGANQCPIGNSPTVGNPINPLTMSKIETALDYDGPATSGLIFARTYHSGAFSLNSNLGKVAARYPAGARIGARWRHTYDRTFVRRPYFDESGYVYTTALHLVREDGSETRFVRKGKTYVPDQGERGTLREDPDGGWAYTLPDLTVEHYDDKGRLKSRVDTNGNTIVLHYDEITVGIGPKVTVLVRVSDRQGRELKLGYDRLGRVETLDTPDGRISYDYSGGILDGLEADLVKVAYPDGRAVRYAYDESGMGGSRNHKLTGILGSDGKRFATFRYDGMNRAISSSHGDNTELTELRTSSASEISVSRPGLRDESWGVRYVDGNIRLGQRSEYYRGNKVARGFDYLSGGLVSRDTDYLGIPTTHRYDPARQLETERTEAEGTSVARTIKTTWHPLFDKPIRVDNGAQWTVLEYDVKGNLLKQREGGLADAASKAGAWPDERVTEYSYDAAGRVLTVDGPLAGIDDVTRYTYRKAEATGCGGSTCAWRQGDLESITNPAGHKVTVLAYDNAGRVASSVDANGVRTDRLFDGMGRPTEVSLRARADGAPSAEDITTRVSYGANGDVDTITDPDGATLKHAYNAAHRLVEQIDAIGQVRRIERNPQGLIAKDVFLGVDGNEELERKYTYDNRGVPEEIRYSGLPFFFDADANGRLIRKYGSVHGPILHRDARGRVDLVTQDPGEINAKTYLTYDGTDQVKTVVDPKGLSTAYLRNGLGDLLWRRSPDTGDTSFEHDAAGQPVRETPADQRRIDRAYDALGRVTSVAYSDGAKTRFTYDTPAELCPAGATFTIGHLSSVTDRDGTTTFCYDFAGRVVQKTQVTHGVRLELQYGYTKAGRLASIIYPDGRMVTYARDKAGNVTGVDTRGIDSVQQSVASTVRHDSLGRLTAWTAGSRTLARTYNGLGAVTLARDSKPGGIDVAVDYTNGDVDQVTVGKAVVYIEMDDASRLSSAGGAFLTPEHPEGVMHQYVYDKTGNRTKWWTIPFTNRSFVYAPDSHRLITGNKIARSYDAVGNTTKIGDRQFVYDASGRMSQALVNGVPEMNYAYNPFGQQVGRYVAGEMTVSLHDEAGHWIGDYDGSGRAIRQIVWLDNLPVAVLDGGAIRDIQTDHLGTPRVVIDRATDKAVWTWSILGEAFGSDAPNEDPDKDGAKYVFDMRFPGQRYDAVTGLFQNGWRDYDPTSGRYVQSDPIGLGGGISTYGYVANNPFGATDINGLDIAVAIDRDAVPTFFGSAGHSATLVGTDAKGWTYYSKDGVDGAGVSLNVRQDYPTMADFLTTNGSRYREGFVISANAIQDFDAKRWADRHIGDAYSGAWNNCADFVRGTLHAGGLDVSSPWLGIDTPNGIRDRIDFKDGEVLSRPLNPAWYPGRYSNPKLLTK